MKLVGKLLQTYIKKDAEHLMCSLHKNVPADRLPPAAKLFSVDALGMYSNIDTDHGVSILIWWLTDYCNELPPFMPVNFVIKSLTEIMKIKNIFQFRNTFWQQKRGCDVGTSSTVNYPCIYVDLLEVKYLLPRYTNQLLFFQNIY
jgi:hypothetical protein